MILPAIMTAPSLNTVPLRITTDCLNGVCSWGRWLCWGLFLPKLDIFARHAVLQNCVATEPLAPMVRHFASSSSIRVTPSNYSTYEPERRRESGFFARAIDTNVFLYISEWQWSECLRDLGTTLYASRRAAGSGSHPRGVRSTLTQDPLFE